ncbi:MAG: 30S ribosomal protein S20 [Lachnospiraceae bacterium]|nr:30S ribosomal protein S20 [Lachnospiraceae bacterium]
MANIKSAKKRILVNRKKALRNKSVKSAVKTQIKKLDSAIAAGNKEAAVAELSNLQKVMSMATSKGIIKKNATSRKISRMATAVNKIGE